MNAQQQSKRNLYLTLQTFLLSNPAITATVANVPEFMADLEAANLQIYNDVEQQLFDSIYVVVNKKNLKVKYTITSDTLGKMIAYSSYVSTENFGQFASSYCSVLPLYSTVVANVTIQIILIPYGLTVASTIPYRTIIKTFSNAALAQSQLFLSSDVF